MKATGYANEYKWKIFRHSSRSFNDGDLGDAPLSHPVPGRGAEYTPFLTVGDVEKEHCETLLMWWDEVQQRRKEKLNSVVTYIGNDLPSDVSTLASGSKPRAKRQHQLIQDVDPDVMAYFNCTVEVC